MFLNEEQQVELIDALAAFRGREVPAVETDYELRLRALRDAKPLLQGLFGPASPEQAHRRRGVPDQRSAGGGGVNLADLARQHRVLLVDFWADTCGPCKRLAPVLDSLVVETPELTVAKVNIDEHPDLAHQLAIMSVPTLVLYVNGEMVAQRTGFAPLRELRSWIQPHL